MKTIHLDGKWQLKPVNSQETAVHTDWFLQHDFVPAMLPGDIHTALIKASVIPDPYYGMNEQSVQWVGSCDWMLSKDITVKKDFLEGQQFISLEFADTIFKLYINGIEAGTGNNMFRKWRFNVTGMLHVGKNTITFVFESAARYAEAEALRLPYPVPYSEYPICSPHRNLVRKAQCHSGWDWGPCIMTAGIYESILLEQTDSGFIDYINTRYEQDGDDWIVEVTTTYTAITEGTIPVSVTVSGPGIEPVITGIPVKVTVGENCIRHTLTVRHPLLWWPAGCAPEDAGTILNSDLPVTRENPLYTLTVTAGKTSCNKKIAFRTLDFISQPDKSGKSVFFIVNGQQIFSKGVNWIPCDALPSLQTPEKYEQLLKAVVDANMNTVRVWGGGQYEKDIFYDICDRLGIIVWQDCMFACALYPATRRFLQNVREEIRHQVRRLMDHPSLGLWCGNNENVGALTWYKESKENRDRYIIDYDRLNEGVLATEIRALDPDRTWWPSSPSAGPDDYSDNWHSDSAGDMHYWSVWHEKKTFDAYLAISPRFVSEFGYESFPSPAGVSNYAPAEQRNLTSPVMEYHQRSPDGNAVIIENFSRYFRFPAKFTHMLYLSQVQQALAIKTAVDYWRSLRPYCMGSIIWQLNDVWPTASWSSIEYSGKWKLLHYVARRFFAPVAVAGIKKDGKIIVAMMNDLSTPVSAALTVSCIDCSGKKLCKDYTRNLTLEPGTVINDHDVFPVQTEFSENSTIVYIKLAYGTGQECTDTLFLGKPKQYELEKPEISYKIVQTTEKTFEITATAEKPAFYVAFDTGRIKGHFSDNMITVLPEIPYRILFTAEAGSVTPDKLARDLSIISLRDTY